MDELYDEDDSEYVEANGSNALYSKAFTTPTKQQIKSLWEWIDPEATPHKIAICGAGGTGKKKLGKSLAKILDVPYIHGVARTVRDCGIDINKKATMESESTIWMAQFFEQLEYDEYVTAGSLIDICAYTHYLIKNDLSDNPFLLRALVNVSWNISINEYSVVFYTPFEDARLKKDGVRSRDVKFQQEIDSLIRYYLDAFDVDYFPLSGDEDEKLEAALDYMRSFGLTEL